MRGIILSVLTISTLTISGGAFAQENAPVDQDGREVVSTKIYTYGVDFTNEASVRAFHSRLARAADQVCDSGIGGLAVRQADVRCAKVALDRAVSNLRQPLLSRINGTPDKTVQLAERAPR